MHIRTRAVHAGQEPDQITGALATGIVQTTAFSYGTLDRGAALFRGEATGWRYSRFGNPTVDALEKKLADLEGGEAAVAFGSGMAAISALVLGLLVPGDEIAFCGPLYGGAESFFTGLASRFGVGAAPISDATSRSGIAPRTRLLWIETPTNPTLALHDLAALTAQARSLGIVTVVDNTLSTPCLTRPLEHGVDLVLHSMTKYLGGHGDVIGGIVVGARHLIETIRKTGLNHLGGNLSPNDAFLFLRGIKTLPLRMRAHCEGALQIAEFLRSHRLVRRVYYPGLSDHPNHDLAKRQMSGGFGGIVAFELAAGTRASAAAVLDKLELFVQAVSLGDVESLACHPASTTHSFISAERRAAEGINEGLIRLSVGIEDPGDLIADLSQALEYARFGD